MDQQQKSLPSNGSIEVDSTNESLGHSSNERSLKNRKPIKGDHKIGPYMINVEARGEAESPVAGLNTQSQNPTQLVGTQASVNVGLNVGVATNQAVTIGAGPNPSIGSNSAATATGMSNVGNTGTRRTSNSPKPRKGSAPHSSRGSPVRRSNSPLHQSRSSRSKSPRGVNNTAFSKSKSNTNTAGYVRSPVNLYYPEKRASPNSFQHFSKGKNPVRHASSPKISHPIPLKGSSFSPPHQLNASTNKQKSSYIGTNDDDSQTQQDVAMSEEQIQEATQFDILFLSTKSGNLDTPLDGECFHASNTPPQTYYPSSSYISSGGATHKSAFEPQHGIEPGSQFVEPMYQNRLNRPGSPLFANERRCRSSSWDSPRRDLASGRAQLPNRGSMHQQYPNHPQSQRPSPVPVYQPNGNPPIGYGTMQHPAAQKPNEIAVSNMSLAELEALGKLINEQLVLKKQEEENRNSVTRQNVALKTDTCGGGTGGTSNATKVIPRNSSMRGTKQRCFARSASPVLRKGAYVRRRFSKDEADSFASDEFDDMIIVGEMEGYEERTRMGCVAPNYEMFKSSNNTFERANSQDSYIDSETEQLEVHKRLSSSPGNISFVNYVASTPGMEQAKIVKSERARNMENHVEVQKPNAIHVNGQHSLQSTDTIGSPRSAFRIPTSN